MKCNKKGGSISFEATKLSVRSYLIQNVKELDYRIKLYKGFLSQYRASTPKQLTTLLGGIETKAAKKILVAQTKMRIQQMHRERKLLKYLLSSLRKTKVSDVFTGAES
jgi:hypothetical protein